MMKKLIIIVFCSFYITSWGQILNPQPKALTEKFFPEKTAEILTPAFQKTKGFTTYKEMMAFLEPLVEQNAEIVKMTYIGESQKGLKVPMLNFSLNNNQDNKVKVWLQGGLHGDEPASTEGLLHLIYKMLAQGELQNILQKVDIAIVPMANVDGYNRQIRDAVNGLDLNRDQTKLNIKESVFLKQNFSDYAPDVAVDFHEYRAYRRDFVSYGEYGVTNPYDAMFLYSGNLNVPKNLREFTEKSFVNPAKEVLKAEGLRTYNYFSTSDCQGYDCINLGSVNARSSATSYALSNTISTLIEVRGVALGRTSFKRRTLTTYWVAKSYLQQAFKLHKEVKSEIETAIASKSEAVVESIRKVSKADLPFIDIATNEIINLNMILRNALESEAVLSRKRPTAYILLASEEEAAKKLRILGLKVEALKEEKTLEVETYKVENYRKSMHKYEGVKRQFIRTEVSSTTHTFPKGSFIVNMNQRNANLAIETLEPEASNSFVSFSVIKTDQGQTLPYYRYIKQKSL